jgi:hypothetical protein
MSSIDNDFGNKNSAPHVSLSVGFEFLENITIASSNSEKCVVHDRHSLEVYIKTKSKSRSHMMNEHDFFLSKVMPRPVRHFGTFVAVVMNFMAITTNSVGLRVSGHPNTRLHVGNFEFRSFSSWSKTCI